VDFPETGNIPHRIGALVRKLGSRLVGVKLEAMLLLEAIAVEGWSVTELKELSASVVGFEALRLAHRDRLCYRVFR